MIIGIGIDIAERERIKKTLLRHNARFIERILSDNEQQKASTLNNERLISFMTKRFSAKEAISKAIGCGIGKLLSWRDIEITSLASGRPSVAISPKIFQAILAANPGLQPRKTLNATSNRATGQAQGKPRFMIHVSISDEKSNAVTQAALEMVEIAQPQR